MKDMLDEFSVDRTGWARFSADRRFRYRLARALTNRPLRVALDPHRGMVVAAERRVVFLMLNPSTADAFVLDPTVRRCAGFARAWGADVLEVVNLFALRSTDPQALYVEGAELGDDRVDADCEIRSACTGAHRVVAGWGVHGVHRSRGERVRRMLDMHGFDLHHLGLTKDGHPKHPLYLKATTELEAWAP